MAALHPFWTDDARLEPIRVKVMAGELLNAEDALALYRTGDILAVGWMANHIRERLHGNTTYFNVNRHINPTNVCVLQPAACVHSDVQESAPPAPTLWRSKKPLKQPLPDIARPSPSFTSLGDCILISLFNISLISVLA